MHNHKYIDSTSDAIFIHEQTERLLQENILLQEIINLIAIDFHNHVGLLNPKYDATIEENKSFYIDNYKNRAVKILSEKDKTTLADIKYMKGTNE